MGRDDVRWREGFILPLCCIMGGMRACLYADGRMIPERGKGETDGTKESAGLCGVLALRKYTGMGSRPQRGVL